MMHLMAVLTTFAYFHAIQPVTVNGEASNMENKIVFNGTEVVIKCKLDSVYWQRRTDGNTLQEIYDGASIIDKVKNNFEIYNVSGKGDLKLLRATFQDAGLYECLSTKTGGRFITNLIIIDESIICTISRNSSWITWNTDNKDIAVNCSFNYKADLSCRLIPLLTNPETNQNLSTTAAGFKNGYLSFEVTVSDDFVSMNNSGLSVVFQCNFDGYQSYSIYKTNYTLPLFPKIADSLRYLEFRIPSSICVFFMGLAFFATLIHFFKRKKQQNQEERPSIKNEPLPDVPVLNKPIDEGLSEVYDEVLDRNSKSISFRNSIIKQFRKKTSYKDKTISSEANEISEYKFETALV